MHGVQVLKLTLVMIFPVGLFVFQIVVKTGVYLFGFLHCSNLLLNYVDKFQVGISIVVLAFMYTVVNIINFHLCK